MAHFVVASLTDQQFTNLQNSGIPHQEIPQELVARFVAILPAGLAPVEALLRLVRMAIRDGEHNTYKQTEGRDLDARVRQNFSTLTQELGL